MLQCFLSKVTILPLLSEIPLAVTFSNVTGKLGMLVVTKVNQEIVKFISTLEVSVGLLLVDSKFLSPEQFQSQYLVTTAFSVKRLLLVTITNQIELWMEHLFMLWSGIYF